MDLKRERQEGGLILNRKELESILDESGTLGLAFAVSKPGQAKNVNLRILRVYANGETLIGEERKCRIKKGAKGTLHYPTRKVDSFRFKFLDKLQKDNFFFGFYSKEQFDRLFKDDWDEVFIGGGKVTYTDTSHLERELDEWFTLTISLRKKIRQIVLKKGQEVNDLIAKRWPQKTPIKINQLDTEKYISFQNLLSPEILKELEMHSVNSYIINEKNKLIKGIVLKVNRELHVIIFQSKLKVSSIILSPDNSLRFVGTHEKTKNSFIPISPSESMMYMLGRFPSIDHMTSYPPHWDNRVFSSSFRNTLKDSILEVF